MSANADDSPPSLVTQEMIGYMVVFGADIIVLVGLLWAVDMLSGTVALSVSLLVVGAFLVWILGRWVRIVRGRDDGEDAEPDPVATLQQRYAEGEIDEAEFERRLDRLLESSPDGVDAEGDADADADSLDRDRLLDR